MSRLDIAPSESVAATTAALLMVQSATDDILLNWSDGFAAANNIGDTISSSVPPRTQSQRKHCGPSTSSDYSSFDVIDKSAMLAYSAAPGGPVCSACDRLLPDDASPYVCRFASSGFARTGSRPVSAVYFYR